MAEKAVGCRVTAIAGALLTIIGMVSAAFCTQIWQLVIAYSFVASKHIISNLNLIELIETEILGTLMNRMYV